MGEVAGIRIPPVRRARTDGHPALCEPRSQRRDRGTRCSGGLRAADGGFDGAVGFVGGDEDVVGVLLAEAAEVDEEVVLVGHEEIDLVDEGGVVECGFGHGEEGLLHGEGVVFGEGGEQGFAEVGADLVEVDGGRARRRRWRWLRGCRSTRL